jgi:poly-gamma-glutamate synthesis protein (capsule biosynthesis protein)
VQTTTAVPTTLPSTQPTTQPQVVELTLTFVGDCTLGTNQNHGYKGTFHEYYDKNGPDYFLENVRHIFRADDLTVVNLEGSLTTSTDIQDKMWNHKGDPEYVEIMTSSSVEVATMGNNHRLDYGQSGCDETEQVLTDAGISYCYDDIYLIYQVKGVKVGFVSVNEHYDGRTVETWLTEGYQYLRQKGCVIVVACVHWGLEKTPVLNDYQLELGYKLIDMGYDLVVGNHPHVLQEMEEYNGKIIFYSLGNFSFGGNDHPKDYDSAVIQQQIVREPDGTVRLGEMTVIPICISSVSDRNNYQPIPYPVDSDAYNRVLEKLNGTYSGPNVTPGYDYSKE